MERTKKTSLPMAGTAFAFRLGDGRFSVCRVLLDATHERSKQWNGDTILVACSSWIGDQVPRANEPSLRPILHLNHHLWDNKPNALWVSEEPPPELIPIGTIVPTAEEQAISCMSFGGWNALTLHPLAQWRWDHERDSVLEEDMIQEKKDREAREQAQRDRENYLVRITLDKLRSRQFFSNWGGYRTPEVIATSRKLMTNTVEELIKLGSAACENDRMAVLQRCIESFNELNGKMHFIDTIDREHICEEFEAIVHACGLGHHEHLADRWRDW
jgi:hypothetical protein